MVMAGPCADRAAFVLPAFDAGVLLLRREAVFLLVKRAQDLPAAQLQSRDHVFIAGRPGYLDCALEIETRVVATELGKLTFGLTHGRIRNLSAPREIRNVTADVHHGRSPWNGRAVSMPANNRVCPRPYRRDDIAR